MLKSPPQKKLNNTLKNTQSIETKATFEKVRIGCRFEDWTLISLGRRSESYIYI
jgi:hypothetical protein